METLKTVGKLGIRIEFIEMESKGCFIKGLNTIFISNKLSQEEFKRVVYHELKHVMDHSDYTTLYTKPTAHLKFEAEANDYMIRQIINENGGIYNYTQLIESFRIGMGNDVKYAEM